MAGSYIDKDDRVVVVNARAFGKHGLVLSNNGFGGCVVQLDEGGKVFVQNERDLQYEAEELPEQPVNDDDLLPLYFIK